MALATMSAATAALLGSLAAAAGGVAGAGIDALSDNSKAKKEKELAKINQTAAGVPQDDFGSQMSYQPKLSLKKKPVIFNY